ncbi:MAG: hypothetical protein WCY77_03030 [Weeksellaceae bacterium]
MKGLKLFLSAVVLSFGLSSCLDDEPTTPVNYNYKAIDSVVIDQVNPLREITEIKTYFTRNNTCEAFFDYKYFAAGFDRDVVLVTSTIQDPSCQDTSVAAMKTLKFLPERPGTYLFRFWAGTDENGDAIYITKEVGIL